MATYYVDPAATGLNDGLTWADAFTDMQSAVAVATSGDVVYCRGTQVLSTAITLSCSGSTSGMIDWIGCNASGVDDGTRFVLDGNSVAANCLNSDGGGYNQFKNFEITGATGNGVDDATSDSSSCVFINCKFHLNGGMGFNSGSWGNSLFFRCSFDNNGSYGLQSNYVGTQKCFFCTFIGNGNDGYYQYINTAYSSFIFGCIFADNSNYGLDLDYGGWNIINCVIDGNGGGGINTDLSDCYRGVTFVGNRLTNNNGYGFYDAGIGYFIGVVAHNFFNNNASGDFGTNISLEGLLEDTGVDTNQYTGTIGYVDAANGDYNLTSDATMRRVPVTLPE